MNRVNGERVYRAYRKLRADEVDHSGNREYAGEYSPDLSAVQALCDYLNAKESQV